MAETSKDLERRELVFRILDDLKARGERINADKVARLAQMGKQTVLPFYNEWRFLDEAEREADDDLPADLVRVLKRGLIQWKHQVAQEQRECEEKANLEIDQLQLTVQQLAEERLKLSKELSAAKENNNQLQEQVKEAEKREIEHEKRQIALETQFEAEIKKGETLQTQITSSEKAHKEALAAQEKQLDNQHHAQVSHWMKVVDDERRLRNTVEQQLLKTKEEISTIKKEKGSLENRLEAKSRAHLDACEERNGLREQTKQLEPRLQTLNELELLAKVPEGGLIDAFQALLQDRLQSTLLSEKLQLESERSQELEGQLNRALKENRLVKTLEMQLEKQKGYREALETSLQQANTLLQGQAKP